MFPEKLFAFAVFLLLSLLSLKLFAEDNILEMRF